MADDLDDVDALLEEPYKNKVRGCNTVRVLYQKLCVIKLDTHVYNMMYDGKKGTFN